MKTLRFIIILIACLITSTAHSAQEMSPAETQKLIDLADKAYEVGNYTESIKIYDNIATQAGTSSALMVNMGNAYLRAGDLGYARVCYQRALKLNPSDKEARHNINYIENKVLEANKADTGGKNISVAPESRPFVTRLRDRIVKGNSSNMWATVAGVFFVITIACVALYIFMQNVLLRKVGFFGGIICGAVCIMTLCFAFWSASANSRQDQGVVTGYKIVLHSEPFVTSKPSSLPLNRGTLLEIMQRDLDDDSWYKVRLNSDYVGWINTDDFEVI